MSEDTIARIDQALGCQYCGKALTPDGPSPDFCGEPCRSAWHAKLADPLPPVKVEGRPERVFTADRVVQPAEPIVSEAVRDYRTPEWVAEVTLELIEEIDCPLGWLQRWCDRMRGRYR